MRTNGHKREGRAAARGAGRATLVGESLGRRAGADQVAVAERVVDAAHGRPVLAGAQARDGEGCGLASICVLPDVRRYRRGGVRGTPQRGVLYGPGAVGDGVDLRADRDERVEIGRASCRERVY